MEVLTDYLLMFKYKLKPCSQTLLHLQEENQHERQQQRTPAQTQADTCTNHHQKTSLL